MTEPTAEELNLEPLLGYEGTNMVRGNPLRKNVYCSRS